MLDASVRAQILAVLVELPEAPGPGAAVHHPRPQPRLVAVRPDRGHVPGPGRRAGRRGRRDRAAPASLHAGAGRPRSRCRRPGGGGRRELLAGELPDPTDDPAGLPLPPALPEALRALRPGRPARWSRPAAATSSPPACCTTPRRDGWRPKPRWLSSAGETSPVRSDGSRPASGTRSPTCPASGSASPRPRAASDRASRWSRRRRCRRRRAPRSSTGWASWPAKLEIDERGTDGDARLPVRLARGRHRHPGRDARLGTRAGRHRAAGGRRVRRRRHGRLAQDRRRRRRRGRSRPSATEVAEGTVGAGTGMSLLRLPGRDRDGLAAGRATTTSGCCCSATSATASTWTCSAWISARAPASSRDRRLLHRGLRHRRAVHRRSSCGDWRCARCSAWRGPAPTRAEGSGEIGVAFTTVDRSEASRTPSSTATSPPPSRPPRRRSTTACVAARPAERLDGTMQEGFPLERVREAARESSAG